MSAQAERKPGAFFHPQFAPYVGSSANSVAVCAPNVFASPLVFPAFCPGSRVVQLPLEFAFLCVECAHSALSLLSDTAGWSPACYHGVWLCVSSLTGA